MAFQRLNWIERSGAGWTLKLALFRLAARWQSLLTIIIGMLIVAVIGASFPLYTAAVAQIGMVQRLDARPAHETHLFARTALSLSAPGGFSAARDSLDAAVRETVQTGLAAFPAWPADVIHWGESSPMFILMPDGGEADGVKAAAADFESLADYAEVTAGRLPDDAQTAPPFEVVLSERAAAELGVTVDAVLTLDQRGWATSRPFDVRIVGLIRERAANSPYWMEPSPLRGGALVNVLMSRTAFDAVTVDYTPDAQTTVGWRVLFDHAALPSGEALAAADAVDALGGVLQDRVNRALDARALTVQTGLPAALREYVQAVDVLAAPFGLILIQVGALTLFFLAVMSGLVRRSEQAELALWRSRGADGWQIVLVSAAETVIVALIAAAAAPLMAYALLSVFIPVLTSAERLSLVITADAYLFAGLATGLAVVLLTALLIPGLRKPLVSAAGQAERAPQAAWWQRYYLDVVVLVIGGLALWQMTTQRSAISGAQADPLLLLIPVLLFFGIGSLSMRLFPPAMQATARLLAGRRGLTWALAAWQVSRDPRHYAQITLLLALSISMGWFAVSFQDTLTRSQSDRAAYQVGADVRLTYDGRRPAPPIEALAALDGTQAVSPALRLEGIDLTTGAGLRLTQGTLLAVDAAALEVLVDWRDDLGPLVLPDGSALAVPERGVALAGDAGTFTVTARLDRIDMLNALTEDGTVELIPDAYSLASALRLSLRLRQPDGVALTVRLEPDLPEGFPPIPCEDFRERPQADVDALLLRAELPPEAAGARVEGIMVAIADPQSFDAPFRTGVTLTLSAPEVTHGDGSTTALDWFTDPDRWQFVPDSGVSGDGPALMNLPDAPPEALRAAWSQRSDQGRFGLLLDYPEITTASNASGLTDDQITAIPAVISESYAEANDLAPGQKFRIVIDQTSLWLQVQAVTRYFPTLNPDDAPFIVTPYALTLYALQRRPTAQVYDNERWISVDGSAAGWRDALDAGLQGGLTGALDRETLRAGMQTDLLTTGLVGLLLLAFVIGVVLSIISLMTYTALNVRARRRDLVTLRALGWPLWRMAVGLTLEQAFVILLATGLGASVGALLSAQVLPALSISATGSALVPPYRVTFDPALFAVYCALIVIVFVAQSGFAALLVNRLARETVKAAGGDV